MVVEYEETKSRLDRITQGLTEAAAQQAGMTPEWEAWLEALPRPETLEDALRVIEELAGRGDLPEEVAHFLLGELQHLLEATGVERGSERVRERESDGSGDGAASGKSLTLAGVGEGAMESTLEALAEAVSERVYRRLAEEPATKSAPFAFPAVIRHRDQGLTPESAFKTWMHRGERAWREVALLEEYTKAYATKAAMNEGTGSQGGVLVPVEYSRDLIRALSEDSVLRRARAGRITMHDLTLKIPTVVDSARAVLTSEAGSYSEIEPTLAETTFTAYKGTKLCLVSDELVADSRYDVWGEILRPDFAQAFAGFENFYFTTGTGSSQPQGVVTGAGVGKTSASATSPTADEIIDLFYSLNHLYRSRPSCAWMMADATAQYLRKLKDGNGDYLWGGDLTKGQAETLLGKPVLINPEMPSLATTNKPILFGDFSYYKIGDREELTMKRLVERYADTGQVGFRAYKRVDGHVMLAAAFKVLQLA